jgi:hypothetical protein
MDDLKIRKFKREWFLEGVSLTKQPPMDFFNSLPEKFRELLTVERNFEGDYLKYKDQIVMEGDLIIFHIENDRIEIIRKESLETYGWFEVDEYGNKIDGD